MPPLNTEAGPVMAGIPGRGLMVTGTLAAAVHPFALVTVTTYDPDIAGVAFARAGFCTEELKPPGPVHEYDTPPDAVSESVVPSHTPLL